MFNHLPTLNKMLEEYQGMADLEAEEQKVRSWLQSKVGSN